MSVSSNRSAMIMILSLGLSSPVAFSQNIRLSPEDSLETVIAKAADVGRRLGRSPGSAMRSPHSSILA